MQTGVKRPNSHVFHLMYLGGPETAPVTSGSAPCELSTDSSMGIFPPPLVLLSIKAFNSLLLLLEEVIFVYRIIILLCHQDKFNLI